MTIPFITIEDEPLTIDSSGALALAILVFLLPILIVLLPFRLIYTWFEALNMSIREYYDEK